MSRKPNPTNGLQSPSYYRIRMVNILHDRYKTAMWEAFEVETDEWDIAQIGRSYWVIDENQKPLFPIGNSAAVAYGVLKGIAHGINHDLTLVKNGVLPEDWEDDLDV